MEIPERLARIVEQIDVRGAKHAPRKISRWQDLLGFSALRTLKATHTDFDIAKHGKYLAGKPDLTTVWFPPPTSSDLTPLGDLKSLTSLSLHANSATDLTPLGDLKGLTSLTLHVSSVTDLTPLGNLTALTALSLYAKSATDLSPLGDLTALNELSLHTMKGQNWDSVIGSAQIRKLDMTRFSTDGCDALGRLQYLEKLYVDSRGLFDLEWLSSLKKLKEVKLKGVQVINQRSLEGVELKLFP